MSEVAESFTITITTKSISQIVSFSTTEEPKKLKAYFLKEINDFYENYKTFDKAIKDFMIRVSQEKEFKDFLFTRVFPNHLTEKIKKVPEEKAFHYSLYLHIKNKSKNKKAAISVGITVGYEDSTYEEMMNTYNERLKKYNIKDEPYTTLKYDLER
jgi:hypothetical protein